MEPDYIDSLNMPVFAASAIFAGFTHIEAAERIRSGISEPALGMLSSSKMQLCPQNRSSLNEQACFDLVSINPSTEFRIHANTSCGGLFGLHDASSDWSNPSFSAWKKQLAIACGLLGAKAYSWHAGRAVNCSLQQAIDRTMSLEQELGIVVGVEGMYPSSATPWLMSSFKDYETVMLSGASFAVDLSHWQIIACASGATETTLLKELLTHPKCMEIHLSDNDGKRDNHGKLTRKPFWFTILTQLQAKGLIKADVFSEGLQESKKLGHEAKKISLY